MIAFPGGKFGSHAEYRTMPEDGLIVLKPANLSFEEAASLSFGGTTALPLLTKAGIKAGDKVLVVGASGGVGSSAVQIAKHFGAEVTGVTSTTNVELVRSIGADRVIDYTREDFAKTGETYDIIFDTTGTAPYARVADALKAGGRLVVVLGTLATMLGIGRPPKSSGKRVIAEVVSITPDHMHYLAQMAASGELKPVIDRVYPLEHAAEAHAYVDTGRKRGSVVLTVKQPEAALKASPASDPTASRSIPDRLALPPVADQPVVVELHPEPRRIRHRHPAVLDLERIGRGPLEARRAPGAFDARAVEDAAASCWLAAFSSSPLTLWSVIGRPVHRREIGDAFGAGDAAGEDDVGLQAIDRLRLEERQRALGQRDVLAGHDRDAGRAPQRQPVLREAGLDRVLVVDRLDVLDRLGHRDRARDVELAVAVDDDVDVVAEMLLAPARRSGGPCGYRPARGSGRTPAC